MIDEARSAALANLAKDLQAHSDVALEKAMADNSDDPVDELDAVLLLTSLSTLCVGIRRAVVCWTEHPELRSRPTWEGLFSEDTARLAENLLKHTADELVDLARGDHISIEDASESINRILSDATIMEAWPRFTYGGDRINPTSE